MEQSPIKEPKKVAAISNNKPPRNDEPETSKSATQPPKPRLPPQMHVIYTSNLKRPPPPLPAQLYRNGTLARASTSSSSAGPSGSQPPPLKRNREPHHTPYSNPLSSYQRSTAIDRFMSTYQSKKQGPRNMHCTLTSISEAAKMNGIQTVAHTSGAKFAVPLTMQAHPIKLNDRMPDEKSDIVNQVAPLPYCRFCHGVLRSWQGYEYHVLKEHVKYRPYRCVHCPKETFYTEEEGRFHTCTHHPECNLSLVKDYDKLKEESASDMFSHLLMMMRDGLSLTVERIQELQDEAAKDVMKYNWLRFKTPLVVVRSSSSIDKLTQTTQSQANQYQPQHQYTPLRTYLQQTADSLISQNPTRGLGSFSSLHRRSDMFLQSRPRK